MLPAAAADGSWREHFETNSLTLTVLARLPGQAYGQISVSSEVPTSGWNGATIPPGLHADLRSAWYPALILLVLAPFAFAWFISRRILLLNVPRDSAHLPPSRCVEDWQRLWKELTPREKLTLHQIALNGFVSSPRPEVRSLVKRGLLRFVPDLRLRNEAFRQFVLAKFQRQEVEPELQAAEQSTAALHWLSVRSAVGLAITVVALFLFFTQQQLWQLALGFATSFATVAQALSKTGGLFRKSAQEKPG